MNDCQEGYHRNRPGIQSTHFSGVSAIISRDPTDAELSEYIFGVFVSHNFGFQAQTSQKMKMEKERKKEKKGTKNGNCLRVFRARRERIGKSCG